MPVDSNNFLPINLGLNLFGEYNNMSLADTPKLWLANPCQRMMTVLASNLIRKFKFLSHKINNGFYYSVFVG